MLNRNGAAFHQARPGPAPPSNTHPLYVDVGMSHQYGLQPIPTPPPSAHGMPSPAHTPAGSNAFSPSALARPSHRHSLPNISDYALNSTPIGELGRRPAPPTSLHQNGVRPMAIQHAQQQQPPRQQQRQQQHAQHQIFVQHPHQQKPPHRPSAAPLDHVRSASYPHSRPTTSQSQIQPQSQPPPQPQPPLASFDPAQTTQLLLQPAKALFEQTWATTVGAVQHELGMYARAHDAVLEQNRVIEQDYRSLYQAYVKTDAERMRLAGELEVARVALGKEDQATREMQLRNGQIALQSQKMREAYSRAASDMEITAKAVQRVRSYLFQLSHTLETAFVLFALPGFRLLLERDPWGRGGTCLPQVYSPPVSNGVAPVLALGVNADPARQEL
ncbi:hypothetical protein OF83DRAFT_471873 [Amylostereum chailletii]|nr:hypothetical protein OF83DRAFT_471873 [Amylostereum chailletii]